MWFRWGCDCECATDFSCGARFTGMVKQPEELKSRVEALLSSDIPSTD